MARTRFDIAWERAIKKKAAEAEAAAKKPKRKAKPPKPMSTTYVKRL